MTDSPLKRLMIVAGGTGGHIFPAKAVGLAALNQSIEVCCIGTQGHLEKTHLSNDFDFIGLKVSGFRGHAWRGKTKALWQMTAALLRSLWSIKRHNPQVVLCMGGYVTVPVAMAAWCLRKKIVCHEQNAIAGMSNKYIAKIATTVLQAFPNSFPASVRAHTVGNPVRSNFSNQPTPAIRMKKQRSEFHLLIIGGSQGALAINQIGLSLISTQNFKQPLNITHQTGPAHHTQVLAQYEKLPPHPHIIQAYPFIDDMAQAFAQADLIIARAGALTVAEACSIGAPIFFIPFPKAVDDHQYKNAHHMKHAGAAKIWRQSDICIQQLSDEINQLIDHPQIKLNMAERARALALPKSGESILDFCRASLSSHTKVNE